MALMAIRCITCARPTGGVVEADKYNELENSKKVCTSCVSYTNTGFTVQAAGAAPARWTCSHCEETDGSIYVRETIVQFRSGDLEFHGENVWVDEVNNDEVNYEVYCSHCEERVPDTQYETVQFN